MKKILFVSHDASLAGAPLVLLYLMEWLRENHSKEYEIGILHLNGGEIEKSFNKAANYVYNIKPQNNTSLVLRVINKLSQGKFVKYYAQKCINTIAHYNYDIIYANSIVSLSTAIQIKQKTKSNVKLVSHVHEMHSNLKYYVRQPKEIVKYIDKIIAVSEVVKKDLMIQWDLDVNKISTVYEFTKINLNKSLKSKSKKFIVGGSGKTGWRKGHQLFIQVANYINKHHPNIDIEFQWVGKIGLHGQIIVDEDLRKLNLIDKVSFVGQQQNPHQYFNNFNLFLMTSREDPFPLVCIEVGMLGKPIICFDQATGTQEMLVNGGGKIVPYLDIERMAEEVLNYYFNNSEMQKDSYIVKQVFSDFTPEKQCPEIFSILRSLI